MAQPFMNPNYYNPYQQQVQPPQPVTFPTNCCGQFNGGGWNNGCGQCGGCNC